MTIRLAHTPERTEHCNKHTHTLLLGSKIDRCTLTFVHVHITIQCMQYTHIAGVSTPNCNHKSKNLFVGLQFDTKSLSMWKGNISVSNSSVKPKSIFATLDKKKQDFIV